MAIHANIAVISDAESSQLGFLENLPFAANIVFVGQYEEILEFSQEKLAKVDVLLVTVFGVRTAHKQGLDTVWSSLPALKWVHFLPAGVTRILTDQLVNSNVILTNGRGTYGRALGEFALAACLHFAKRIPQFQAQQKASKWEKVYVDELSGKTIGIIGYGDLGQATAKIARVFGMKIVAVRRRIELSDAEQGQDNFEVHGIDKLHDVIAASDFVVNALPATPATNKIISAEAIAKLQPNAVFINIGRGTTVDEDALIKALREEKFRGAALDVVNEEPLPESSPLWELENVLITSHSAVRTSTILQEAVQRFIDNAKLYVEGKPLLTPCLKEYGY